jgi:cytoskeletal protein RodZ
MSRAAIKKNPSLQGSGLALSGLIIGYVWLPIYICLFSISFLIALGQQVKGNFKTIDTQLNAVQSTNSADQTTNAPDQSTPTATPTNSPDQSTNSASATNTPDQSTNNSTPSTNASDSTTNAAPVTQ